MRFSPIFAACWAVAAQDGALLVIERECHGCHGAAQQMSKLDLRSRESMLAGGARGAAIVPGDASRSLLLAAIEGRAPAPAMPPGKKLTAAEIAKLREWIDAGAAWSTAAAPSSTWDLKPKDLWPYRPLPARDRSRSIDRLLNARLGAAGIAPAPAADRYTLARRAFLGLTGLPPTPAEVDAFVQDASPDAWPRLIDRLLASPRYGERWARHWLDVVRYADTAGYSNDFERPNAWRYRDYVIRAFNQDKPYDRFIREQIAGDELYPGDGDALIATGFLRAGPWEHTGMSVEAVTRQMFLDDVTHATAATFLGLTLGCARCHDHKFDPIPTRDYYRVQAVFATTEFARPAQPFLASENAAGLRDGAAHMREVYQRNRERLASFDEVSRQWVLKKHGAARVEDLPTGALAAAIRNKDGVDAEAFEEFKLYQKHDALYKESLDRYEPKAFAVSSGPLDGATDGGPNLRYARRAAYRASAVHILPGGNVTSPGERVAPGALSALAKYGGHAEPAIPEAVSGRRAALANWIADARNPLTARVMANRIWQYHFGRGLAADANNFGKMGRKPTHPELLDWLAALLIDSGWSVKAVHRAILLSDAYQRAGAKRDARDPDNLLLAHFPPRRVEAEVLRDAMLAVAGELSPESGGPGAFPQINEDVARQPQQRMGSVSPAYRVSARKSQRNRRTIYTFQQRTLQDPMVEVFNGPTLDLSCERRETATLPTQAFTLLNGQFAHDLALAFALRLERERREPGARVALAFRLAYGRLPEEAEIAAAREHLRKMEALHAAAGAPPVRAEPKPVVHTITSELTGRNFRFAQPEDPGRFEANAHPSEASPQTRALADLALVLLNSNEFVYVY